MAVLHEAGDRSFNFRCDTIQPQNESLRGRQPRFNQSASQAPALRTKSRVDKSKLSSISVVRTPQNFSRRSAVGRLTLARRMRRAQKQERFGRCRTLEVGSASPAMPPGPSGT